MSSITIQSLGWITTRMTWTSTSTTASMRKRGGTTQGTCFIWAGRCLTCLNCRINNQDYKQMLSSRKTPTSTSFSRISTAALTILIRHAQWMSLLKSNNLLIKKSKEIILLKTQSTRHCCNRLLQRQSKFQAWTTSICTRTTLTCRKSGLGPS